MENKIEKIKTKFIDRLESITKFFAPISISFSLSYAIGFFWYTLIVTVFSYTISSVVIKNFIDGNNDEIDVV